MSGFAELVATGSLLVALPVAVLAGLVSFVSPCVLPLVPGYLSYVTGLTGSDLAEQRRWRLVAGGALFVLGFSIVFVTYGVQHASQISVVRPLDPFEERNPISGLIKPVLPACVEVLLDRFRKAPQRHAAGRIEDLIAAMS